jgi:hypothetical protein
LKKQSQFPGCSNERKICSNNVLWLFPHFGTAEKQGQFKAKQTQFDESPDDGLSFLRKQESRFLDRPLFCIKCGMTALEARLTGYYFEKTKPIPWCPNERNLLFYKKL